MPKIKITQKGDFKKTISLLNRISEKAFIEKVAKYGEEGVEALRAATPRRTGKTAESWSYNLYLNNAENTLSIIWSNSNVNKWANVAVLIQYGHGTRGGGYVQGIDYINPAMEPIFQKMADELFMEVTRDG